MWYWYYLTEEKETEDYINDYDTFANTFPNKFQYFLLLKMKEINKLGLTYYRYMV